MLKFRDRESYAGNKTKEYDDLAMKYLSYVLFLLVICSSIYSLMYERHKSWYSWILSSLTSCVYMFGKCFSLFNRSVLARFSIRFDLFNPTKQEFISVIMRVATGLYTKAWQLSYTQRPVQVWFVSYNCGLDLYSPTDLLAKQ